MNVGARSVPKPAPNNDVPLQGRIALVTGGASGLGAATAAVLTAQGAKVWIADRTQVAARPSLLLDVTDAAAWDAALDTVLRQDGKLDILVNAAGIAGAGDVAQVALDAWRAVFAVNVEGVLLGCQAALRVMQAGAIVNIASTAGIAPSATLAAYGASKAAVIQLTRSVAAWCAQNGRAIRCNAVAPGMADTPMTAGFTGDYRAAWEAQIPLARFAGAHEIAAAIAFLAGPAASYITGAVLPVDGGLLARPVVR
jgi:NAD(P)-dependent dehydrogenase (short-subunit alcohol dehydrogenase family)